MYKLWNITNKSVLGHIISTFTTILLTVAILVHNTPNYLGVCENAAV